MRYLVGCVFALALVASPLSVSAQEGAEAPTAAALAIHSESHAPLQLRLRASYFAYLDTEPLDGTSTPAAEAEFGLEYKEPELSQEERDLKKRRRRLGLGVGLGVGLPFLVAIGWAAYAASW